MNSLNEIAQFLKNTDNFVILTHRYPDGDTLGSAFALCRALRALGKKSKVIVNSDKLARKFEYLAEGMEEQNFDVQTVIAVDIASASLLGDLQSEYEGRVDVSVDHHGMNSPFARLTYVNAKAAANAENIYHLIKELGAEIDKKTADCIYTGICTDTGCFKFSNVTPDTMRIAAQLMETGCDSALINRIMFDTKTMARIRMEQAALSTLTMHCGGKIAVVYTTLKMEKDTGADESDTDGLAALPRQIEGVVVGITIREKGENFYKASVRTINGCSAASICSIFGGGGHHAAGGCTLQGTIEEVRAKLVEAAENEIAKSI